MRLVLRHFFLPYLRSLFLVRKKVIRHLQDQNKYMTVETSLLQRSIYQSSTAESPLKYSFIKKIIKNQKLFFNCGFSIDAFSGHKMLAYLIFHLNLYFSLCSFQKHVEKISATHFCFLFTNKFRKFYRIQRQ